MKTMPLTTTTLVRPSRMAQLPLRAASGAPTPAACPSDQVSLGQAVSEAPSLNTESPEASSRPSERPAQPGSEGSRSSAAPTSILMESAPVESFSTVQPQTAPAPRTVSEAARNLIRKQGDDYELTIRNAETVAKFATGLTPEQADQLSPEERKPYTEAYLESYYGQQGALRDKQHGELKGFLRDLREQGNPIASQTLYLTHGAKNEGQAHRMVTHELAKGLPDDPVKAAVLAGATTLRFADSPSTLTKIQDTCLPEWAGRATGETAKSLEFLASLGPSKSPLVDDLLLGRHLEEALEESSSIRLALRVGSDANSIGSENEEFLNAPTPVNESAFRIAEAALGWVGQKADDSQVRTLASDAVAKSRSAETLFERRSLLSKAFAELGGRS